jgi:hypothetical protein
VPVDGATEEPVKWIAPLRGASLSDSTLLLRVSVACQICIAPP